ncbi:MAG: hypothetical protein WKG07_11380 [Hymenobacter sp.]
MPADSLFRLLYVPIEVPAGTAEIRVREDYNHGGGNVLNLGIYGPEGYRPGTTAGFRAGRAGPRRPSSSTPKRPPPATCRDPCGPVPGTCCFTLPPLPRPASTGS